MTDTETIASLADRLLAALAGADLATLNHDDTQAIARLAGAVTWNLRERIEERQRALWRAGAAADPDWKSFRRTVLVEHLRWASDAILVRRMDTGQYFAVSTNNTETFTFLADGIAPGDRIIRDEISSASGRGMTRTEAITAIDGHDGELWPRSACPHRSTEPDPDIPDARGVCNACGTYVYDDDTESSDRSE